MARAPQKIDLDPDQIPLKAAQAERLAGLAGISARELAGQTVTEIGSKLRFRVDPQLLLFRKICGRVVKKDPATGKDYPVPFATVHVEDTDCSLLGYFPAGSRWSWYFPFRCRREVIATVKTDACGNFCVWIPRWDIDWVLRFRRERRCFGTIFERPSLRDLIGEVAPRIPKPRPWPGPDPDPFFAELDAGAIRQLGNLFGEATARKIGRLQSRTDFGASRLALDAALDATDLRLVPPLPAEMRDVRAGGARGEALGEAPGAALELLRSSLAARLKIEASELERLDPRRFIGPFKRCYEVVVPEWAPILDVPDITFRVTQDTNGDGTEESIYSEGYFQVRWNAGNLPNVVIEAQPHARAGLDCSGEAVPCGNVPAIVLAGRLPVTAAATLYDALSGYALRPNRPHPSALFADALPNPEAAAPFEGTLTLLGCNRTDRRATHYRVVYKYSPDGGATFSSFSPFVGLTWPLFRLSATGTLESHYPAADGNGWYPIALPPGPNPFLPQDILLDWPTPSFADGRYVLKLELGAGGAVLSSSAEVAFNIDNSAPHAGFSVEWRREHESDTDYRPLGYPCPLVQRGKVPVSLLFRVTLEASAKHLRAALVSAGGCGDGNFELLSGTGTPAAALYPLPASPLEFAHWHTSTSDNAVTLKAIYRLPATAHQGTYTFSSRVTSRAFNPNDGVGHLRPIPWEYDPAPLYSDPGVQFSVIDLD